MKSENKTLNEIMQKLRIEFLNYFRTHIYEIFIFVILLFLIYYVNCFFFIFIIFIMQKCKNMQGIINLLTFRYI